jgi:hypothetical protein
MRSLIASLRTLVLPFGATTGSRIVLDGVTGQILVYDANDDLRFRLNPSGGIIELSSAGVNENLLGDIQASGQGSIGTTERFALTVESPQAVNRERSIIDLISESVDGTIGTNIDIFTDLLDIFGGGGSATADIQLNGISLPRGVLPNGKARASSNTTFSTETTIVTTGSVTLIAGRRYRFLFSWRSIVWGTAAAAVLARLRIKDVASTVRMEHISEITGGTARAGGTTQVTLDCSGEIGSGSHTFEVTAERITGAGTLVMEAAGTYPCTLVIEDIGAVV